MTKKVKIIVLIIAFIAIAGLGIWNSVELIGLKKDYKELQERHEILVDTVISIDGFIETQSDFNETVTNILLY